MKVIEHLQQAKGTLVSFEILPPLKGKTISSIYDHLDPLMEFRPAFINVTYHRSETMFKKKTERHVRKGRSPQTPRYGWHLRRHYEPL